MPIFLQVLRWVRARGTIPEPRRVPRAKVVRLPLDQAQGKSGATEADPPTGWHRTTKKGRVGRDARRDGHATSTRQRPR